MQVPAEAAKTQDPDKAKPKPQNRAKDRFMQTLS